MGFADFWCGKCWRAFSDSELASDESGVLHCPRCGAEGGHLRLWAVVHVAQDWPARPEDGREYVPWRPMPSVRGVTGRLQSGGTRTRVVPASRPGSTGAVRHPASLH